MTISTNNRDFSSEFIFKASRSGGKGGQNVNKVNTKVELSFYVQSSLMLTDEEKQLLLQKADNRINQHGELKITCQTERSQLLNKEKVIRQFYTLLDKCLKREKPRKATKPSKGSVQERLNQKRLKSVKKAIRGAKGHMNDE